ncbi:MAG TPA: ammonium transporter [Beijerinckiaceae bacterium]|nr:ammonium transporter [Beijerinckiaceae bacterium]
MNPRLFSASALLMSAAVVDPALAQSTSKIDAADTGFMIVCTALVLMMTLPGLALFYAGMVRRKTVLATMAQSAASIAIVSLLWIAVGYSLTFSGDGPIFGDLSRAFLLGIKPDTTTALAPTIPELLFMLYQMTFAIITCALIGGSVADRMRFSAFLIFSVLWLFLVYVPSAHMVWGNGWLAKLGVIDFAGGTVVHINAGIAGLVAALMIGPRHGYGRDNFAPYDLSMAVVGTGLLWVGWFGFNGGSALGAGSRAVYAITATHLAACAGAVVWTGLEWIQRGRPSVLGIISGAIAGLGTVTPASGFILPWHGVVIGVIAGALCYWACIWLKHKLAYDDSLDVFGVHGVGGLLGTMLAGVFATGSLSATPELAEGLRGLVDGNPGQVVTQAIGVVVTTLWCAAGTFVALKVTAFMTPLRASRDEEVEGLDLALHGERLH